MIGVIEPTTGANADRDRKTYIYHPRKRATDRQQPAVSDEPLVSASLLDDSKSVYE
jgi:hypothetical protein